MYYITKTMCDKLRSTACKAIPLALVTACFSHAADLPSVAFTHHDWEIACDNTRTCRAAGYQQEAGDTLPVSVLLTRKAGANQPVIAQLQIGSYGSEEALSKLPKSIKLNMQIDGRQQATVIVNGATLIADLPSNQVNILLAALRRNSTISWSYGETTWALSGNGASAVLLKMDEFQGRIGTVTALIRKGNKSESFALPPLNAPVVNLPPLPKGAWSEIKLSETQQKALVGELQKVVAGEDCTFLAERSAKENPISLTRLSDTKLLASTQCWLASYNHGSGYWIINDKAPFNPVTVTLDGTDFDHGIISSHQKGRGLGDCWSKEKWAWDGKQFVFITSASTGMCRLVAPGGAWDLPTLVSDVRHAQQ